MTASKGNPNSNSGPSSIPDKKNVISRVVVVLLFGIISGTIASALALVIADSIKLLAEILIGQSRVSQSGFNSLLFVTPIMGGLVVGLLLLRTSIKKADNIANLILKAQTRNHRFPLLDGLINGVAAIVSMGSGASVGIYGPLSTMGATVGGYLSRYTQLGVNIGIGCGVAAAISTVFSAPIAGILFAHEVVLRHYSMRAFAPITVASSTGFFISNYLLERPVLFKVEATRSFFAPEFFAFVIIGIAGALVATFFMQLVILAARVGNQSGIPSWLRPAVAGIGVGIVAQWLPEVIGIGTELITSTVSHAEMTNTPTIVLLIAKILLSALCVGFGFAGGVFGPSLVIGVLTGSIVGQVCIGLFGELSSGMAFYSISGMLAVTSPVIGGPLTAILIVFELTRNYELTTAVMISVAFSNLVAYRLFGRSLFDRQLAIQGTDLSLGRDKVILQQTPISSFVTTDGVTVNSQTSLADTQRAMTEANRQECFVLDDLSRYVGRLRLSDVISIPAHVDPENADAAGYADNNVLVLQHDLSVWRALDQMQGFIGESIAIVDQRDYYIGVIYQSTLIAAYLQTTENLRAEEHAVN